MRKDWFGRLLWFTLFAAAAIVWCALPRIASAQPVADLSTNGIAFSERRGGVYGPYLPKPTITNQGPGNLVIDSVYLSSESFFGDAYGTAKVSGANCTGGGPYTLAVGQSCDIDVIAWTFNLGLASFLGCYSQGVSISSNATSGVGYQSSNFRHFLSVTFCAQAGANTRVATQIGDEGAGFANFTSRTAPPGALTFPTTSVGATSRARKVIIQSTGSTALTISSITSSLPGVVLDRDDSYCGLGPSGTGSTAVASDTQCEIAFVYKPTGVGAQSGTITIVSNALTSPHVVNFSATGVAAQSPGVSPASVSFGAVEVGNTSDQYSVTRDQVITVSNITGPTGAIVPSLSGPDSLSFRLVSDTCGEVSGGGICTVRIAFTPRGFAGTKTATLTLTMGANVSSIPLSGTAVTTGPAITVSPVAIDFGNVAVGATSAVTPITIQNTGVAGLVISDVNLGGNDFVDTTAVPANRRCGLGSGVSSVVLAPGATCTVLLACSPANVGSQSTTLTVATNAPSDASYYGPGTNEVELACNGTALFTPNDNLAVYLTAVGASTQPGQSRIVHIDVSTYAMAAESGLAMTIPLPPGLVVAASPVASNTCGGVLTATPGASSILLTSGTAPVYPATCLVSVALVAAAAGSFNVRFVAGDIRTAAGAANYSQAVTLNFLAVLPSLSVTPAAINFGVWPPGQSSFDVPITITNTGVVTLSNLNVQLDGAGFSLYGNCSGLPLAAGASCVMKVKQYGAIAGTSNAANFIVTANDVTDTAVAVSGAVAAVPLLTASAVPLVVPSAAIGSSGSTVITLTNASGGALTTATPVLVGDAGFSATGVAACSALNTSAGTCSPTLTFTPTTAGTRNGAIKVGVGATFYYFPVSGSGVTPGDVQASQSLVTETAPLSSRAGTYVTFTNVGASTVTFSAPAVAGSADWTVEDNTCSTVAPASSCGMTLRFTPTAVGVRNATATITHTGLGSPIIITLNGTGLSALTATPSSINYGAVAAGNSSTITVVRFATTTGNCFYPSDVSIGGANAANFEIVGNTCDGNYGFYDSCDVGVRFNSAGTNGARSGSLNITGAYLGCGGIAPPREVELKLGMRRKTAPLPTTVSVPLSGTVGTGGSPAVSLSSGAMTFASQVVATPSSPQSVTVTNTGSAGLTFISTSIVGAHPTNFSQTGVSCSGSLAPGNSCNFNIIFTPSATGARSATLVITTNAAGSPHQILLTGTGGVAAGTPPLIVSNSALPSGMTGQQYGHTFVATGTGPITWSVFSGSLPPGLTLSTGGSLSGVPTQPGTFSFVARATNSAGTASQGVAILVAAPLVAFISASPSSLTFGNQATLTTSPSQTVTITSTGNGPAQIQAIVGSGDFSFNSGCPLAPATLAPGATCTISVAFAPLIPGPLTGGIGVTTTTGNSASISLAGNGVNVPRPSIAITPGSLIFGDQAVGSTSAQQSFTISNSGQADLQLRGLDLSGSGFSTSSDGISNGCGGIVKPGASCRIGIVFAPTVTGPANAAFNITHNATPTGESTTVGVGLTGNGTPKREPVIRVSGNLFFNEQVIGTVSPIQTVSVSNAGTANLAISGISVNPVNANTNSGDFSVGGNCGTLTPGASCTLTVTFTPSAPIGAKGAILNIGSNASNAVPAGGGTVGVGLSGTAAPVPQPVVKLSSTTIGFGTSLLGSLVPSQVVTLTNAGSRVLTNIGIGLVGEYIQSNNCGATLNPNQSCSINILFVPQRPGLRPGSLSITSNAPSNPDQVILSGTGCIFSSNPAAGRLFVRGC